MQLSLGRSFTLSGNEVSAIIDFNNIAGRQRSLVDTRSRDPDTQRLATYDSAQVPAGSEHPSPAIELASDLCQNLGNLSNLHFLFV